MSDFCQSLEKFIMLLSRSVLLSTNVQYGMVFSFCRIKTDRWQVNVIFVSQFLCLLIVNLAVALLTAHSKSVMQFGGSTKEINQ